MAGRAIGMDARDAGPQEAVARGRSRDAKPIIVHGTAVAHTGSALLLRGGAGSGKSALALQMIALGATLVSDDRTCLNRSVDAILATPPLSLAGLIEVRGLGLLEVPHCAEAALIGVVDLDAAATERLPPARTTSLLGRALPLYRCGPGAHLASALVLCLKGARIVTDTVQPQADRSQPRMDR
ncbi:MAG: serine kinase [Pseudomonadota bacterium]